MNAEVRFTPLGNRIKYRITGKVFCNRMQIEIANNKTYYANDAIWLNVFTKQELHNFLIRNKPVTKVINLSALGYDSCDNII